MWFKITLFVLEITAFSVQVVTAKTEGARFGYLAYGAAIAIGYAHYIMGWF